MAQNIDLVVTLNLIKVLSTLSLASFSIPLVFQKSATASKFSGQTKLYTSLDTVKTDFGSGSDEYKAISAIFAQDPKPQKVRVAKRATPVAVEKTLSFSRPLVSGETVDGVVNGVTLTSVVFDTNMATTLGALRTQILAIAGIDTVTVASNTLEIVALDDYSLDISGFVVTGNATAITATVSTDVAGSTIVDDFYAAKNDKNDFYYCLAVDRSDGLFTSLARVVETEDKMCGYASSTSAIKTTATTDIMSKLKNLSLENALNLFHHDLSEYADFAWAGVFLGYAPGVAQPALKTLKGVTPSPLSPDEIQNVLDKNCNVYIDIADTGATNDGRTAKGTFADFVRDLHYLKAVVNTDMVNLFLSTPKITGNDNGIKLVGSTLRLSLNQIVKDTIIEDDFIINLPKIGDIPNTSRLNRILDSVSFIVKLQGAFIKVVLDGTALA